MSSRGYTFIELIVVSAILAILASAIVPMTRITMQRQREVELRRNLREIRTAIDKFKDAVDLGMIPQNEVSPGSENYPKSLEQLVVGAAVANDASGRRLKFLRRVPIDIRLFHPMAAISFLFQIVPGAQTSIATICRPANRNN